MTVEEFRWHVNRLHQKLDGERKAQEEAVKKARAASRRRK